MDIVQIAAIASTIVIAIGITATITGLRYVNEWLQQIEAHTKHCARIADSYHRRDFPEMYDDTGTAKHG